MNIRMLIPLMVWLLAVVACNLTPTPEPTQPAGNTPTGTHTATATLAPPTEIPSATPTEVASMFPTPTSTTETLSGDVQVTIQALQFGPEVIKVKAGSTVHWTNNDDSEHIIVADDGSFSSGTMSSGDEFTFTFHTAGVFTYHCGIHLLMKGTIIVVP